MIVNPNVLEELIDEAGFARKERAQEYVSSRRINIKKVLYDDSNNFEIRSKVKGNSNIYDVYIKVEKGEIDNVKCTCQDYYEHYGTCKHILATAIEFNQNENYIRIFSGENKESKSDISIYKKYQKQEEKYREFKQLLHSFYPNHIEEEKTKTKTPMHSIKLEPKLIYNSYLKTLKLEIKIGDKQLYKLKNFPEFYERMLKKENYSYGAKLEFIHEKEIFEESSLSLLDYILKYAEIIKYANEATNQYSYYGRTMEDGYITISNTGIDELFEVLKNKRVLIQKDSKEDNVLFLEETPKIEFNIKEEGKKEYVLSPNIDVYEYEIFEGRNNCYFLYNHILYKCNEEFKETTLKLLQSFRNSLTNSILFPKEEITNLFSIVFPKVKNQIQIESLNKEEIEKYIPKELSVKVYLDYNEKNHITADIKFVYENYEFNPLLEEETTFTRDLIKEDEVLELFKKSGFMLDVENKRLILVNEELIYEFLSYDIEAYMKQFEVLATDNFKKKEIREPKIGTLGVKVENNLLKIDFSNIDFDISEIKEIMEKYHLKKKYHRLKDGSFLNLEENNDINFIDNALSGLDINYKELEKGEVKLPIYRSFYLDRILENLQNTSIQKNEEYKNLINKLEEKSVSSSLELPKNLNANLRNYQKTGYEWLKTIDNYGFGGILADDMGLRKNFTIISYNIRLCSK